MEWHETHKLDQMRRAHVQSGIGQNSGEQVQNNPGSNPKPQHAISFGRVYVIIQRTMMVTDVLVSRGGNFKHLKMSMGCSRIGMVGYILTSSHITGNS